MGECNAKQPRSTLVVRGCYTPKRDGVILVPQKFSSQLLLLSRCSNGSGRCLLRSSKREAIQMDVLKIAAFSDGDTGGNPAGVVIGDISPDAAEMQAIAAKVGFSETVFAAPDANSWRASLFFAGVPGSVLLACHDRARCGAGPAVRGRDFRVDPQSGEHNRRGFPRQYEHRRRFAVAATRSRPAAPELVAETLALFGYTSDDLDPAIPPALIHCVAATISWHSRRARRLPPWPMN